MSEHPLVTIGIPTYNRATDTLPQTLECALRQTYPNLEIVVSDNASTDSTEAYMTQIVDPRVRYIRHPRNIGGNNNFNHCLEVARGTYFQLLHDDDLIDEDFVMTCMAAIEFRDDVGFVQTGTRVINRDGAVVQSATNRTRAANGSVYIRDWFSSRTTIYLCSTLYNTAGLRGVGGFASKHNLLEDVMACAKLSLVSGQVPVPAVKASFRRHDTNRGGGIDMQAWCDDSLDLLDTICRMVPEAEVQSVRDEGLRFLCRMNYSIVCVRPGLRNRLRDYRLVAASFEHAASPWSYFVRRDIKPRLKSLGRALWPAQ